MQTFILIASFAGGYVAAIFTWQAIHTWWVGAEAKAAQLRSKAAILLAKMRGL